MYKRQSTLSSIPTYRLAPPLLNADRDTLEALQDLHDYRPRNPDYSVETLAALEAELTQAQQDERRLRKALNTGRNRTIQAAHAFHQAAIGAKAEVVVQYGPNSNQVKSVGLKRKSDRRRLLRRSSPVSQNQ